MQSFTSADFDRVEKKITHSTSQTKKEFKEAVDRLAAQIAQFPYKELRAIPQQLDGDPAIYYGASSEAIRALKTMILSNYKKLTAESIHAAPTLTDEEVWLKLANSLLLFRNQIEATEKAHTKATKVYSEDHAVLHNDNTWVMCFHFMIEKFIVKSGPISESEYGATIKKLQNLCLLSYKWVAKNRPSYLSRYTCLGPKDKAHDPERRTASMLTHKLRLADIFDQEASPDKKADLSEEATGQTLGTGTLPRSTMGASSQEPSSPLGQHGLYKKDKEPPTPPPSTTPDGPQQKKPRSLTQNPGTR